MLEFFGLGGTKMYDTDPADAKEYAEQGIIFVVPYYNPWCWMNAQAVDYVDEIVGTLTDNYGLGKNAKVVSTGGSMGGIGALNFTKNSRHNVVGCMAACPCYDILGEYNSFAANPSFPRTYVSAVYTYDMPLADALKSITPCENIEAMPKVPYYIVCNENDECFDDDGMKKFAKDMEDAGHTVTFKFLPDTKHGEFTDEERVSYQSFIIDTVLGK